VLAALSVGWSGPADMTASARPVPHATPAIRFAVNVPRNVLKISAPGYVLTLSRTNGAVLSLLQLGARAPLVRGGDSCLWGAKADGGNGLATGGCAFARGSANAFSYTWNRRSSSLTLVYRGDRSAPRSVTARAVLHAQSTFFDLRLTLTNNWHHVLSNVLFPADLLGASATVTAGYAPNFLPGVKLRPAFFNGGRDNILTYPSRPAFADYLALDLADGHLALYSVNPAPNPLAPVDLGFVRGVPPTQCSGRFFCITHSFDTWITNGSSWTSPLMRVRVGDTVDKTILDYRHENGIDAYPSVSDKLGSQTATYAAAPLIKADARKRLPPLADWGPELQRLPSPALLHPVSYQSGIHDQNDPDFLPPDPALGTAADLRAMVDEAHALGLLVMPYLNVSWWNAHSPTTEALLAKGSAKQFAVLNASGDPVNERYPPFDGYLVSPYAPAVRDRVATLMDQWQSTAPTDCSFFDQIGARDWRRDFNSAEPSPLAYDDGWLSLMAPYASRCLMVEDGWDRLARSFVGFHGGLLLMQRISKIPDQIYGEGNWQPYPLADWLFHDKVLFYQHDLYEGTMTADPQVLMWNAAFGFMLSYSWDATYDTLDSPWLDVVGSFQHALGPLYAGQQLQSYTTVAPQVTQTTFPNVSVLANWSSTDTYSTEGYGLAPTGFLARSQDGNVVAGSFSGQFDGAGLSPGTHDLVVTRTASTVTVHQPLGDDTQLAVQPPSSLQAGKSVQVTAAAADGRVLRTLAGTIDGGRVVFTCAGPGPNGPAPTYRLTSG
jgi:hypothetical protein